MWRKFAVFLVLISGATGLPTPGLAQGWWPRADDWFGVWSSWWWICPLMMLVMMLAMMFACRFMCSWRRH